MVVVMNHGVWGWVVHERLQEKRVVLAIQGSNPNHWPCVVDRRRGF